MALRTESSDWAFHGCLNVVVAECLAAGAFGGAHCGAEFAEEFRDGAITIPSFWGDPTQIVQKRQVGVLIAFAIGLPVCHPGWVGETVNEGLDELVGDTSWCGWQGSGDDLGRFDPGRESDREVLEVPLGEPILGMGF